MKLDITAPLGYRSPIKIKINKSVNILVYKPFIYNNKYKDIIEIYNSKENKYITLYNTTLYKIYTIIYTTLNKKKRELSKKKVPLKKKVK